MLRIAMAEVVLLGSKIGALVGQIVSATVAQHVWPHSAQLGVLAGDPTDVIDRLPGELGVAFGVSSGEKFVKNQRFENGHCVGWDRVVRARGSSMPACSPP